MTGVVVVAVVVAAVAADDDDNDDDIRDPTEVIDDRVGVNDKGADAVTDVRQTCLSSYNRLHLSMASR